MAKGTLGQGMRDGTETVVWLGNTGVLGKENKKKGKKLNITVGDADCIHRVGGTRRTPDSRRSEKCPRRALLSACTLYLLVEVRRCQ